MFSDTSDLRKYLMISTGKGSDDPCPKLPGATRGKTTAEQDFFLP